MREKRQLNLADSKQPGSPPHMRGKDRRPVALAHGNGITPAYAGKSINTVAGDMVEQDHPRICGEKCMIARLMALSPGSPPHMRGKVSFADLIKTAFGITPAYAGKSKQGFCPSLCLRDHPRICGEKQSLQLVLQAIVGSPPHMRGKERCGEIDHLGNGITPAYAGKRPLRSSGGIRGWDHPRICGEKLCFSLPAL